MISGLCCFGQKKEKFFVAMSKEDYVKKAEELLNTDTYRTISNDPTNKYKNKLINLLKTIKAEGGISDAVYKRLYPTGAGEPKFYGLPKIHKEGMPPRPIVSSIGASIYETSKSWPGYWNLWWANPHTKSRTAGISYSRYRT